MTSSPRTLVERHVLPSTTTPPIDADGFLDVNQPRIRLKQTGPTPWELNALAHRPGSFVLMASDGVGKSIALRHLQQAETGSRWLDLSHFDLGGLRSELDRIATPGTTLYVDGVDIGLLYEPRLAVVLADRLEDPGLSEVRWRFGCRPASWSDLLAKALHTHVAAEFGVGEADQAHAEFILLPLTRHAATDLAAAVAREPRRFIEELATARLGRLAGHPGRLEAVAARWDNGGSLPSTQVEALEFETEKLLFEAKKEQRSESVNEDRKAVIAERLGAFTMFCSADRYSFDEHADANVAIIGTLPFEAEPAEPGIEYPPGHYRVVLGSALFDRAGDGAMGFRHQQYAEYLAARYLVKRRTPPEKIRMLLGVQEDGTLPRAMTAVAAWIAALAPDSIRSLVVDNATAFLESRVDLPSDDLRRDIVHRILTAAAEDDIDVLFGQNFTNLTHPDLESQLLQQLEEGPATAVQLWWIANLAEDGACAAAIEQLQRHLYTATWPTWARRACAHTIGALGTPEQRATLTQLLYLSEQDDPDDDLFAEAIDALFPEMLSTDQLLEVLRPRRNENYTGPYQVLLGMLPQRVPPTELAKALDWASTHAASSDWGFGQLVPKLVATAWHSPHQADLLPHIAQLVAAGADREHWGRAPFGTEPPWVKEPNTEQRRQLLLAVLGVISEDDSYRLSQLGLFTDEDPLWAIRILPSTHEPIRSMLARWVAHSDQNPSVTLIDAVLSLPEDHPAYEPTTFWREAIPINCHLGMAHRKRLARDAEQSARKAEQVANHKASLNDTIDAAAEDPDQWWKIPLHLRGTPRRADWLAFDITEHEGWSELDPLNQERVLDIGCRYLETHNLDPSAWLGVDSIRGDLVLPDWSGVFLLATLMRHWPERLAQLDPRVWSRWAPAIIEVWDPDLEGNNTIRRDLMNCIPETAQNAFIEALWAHLAAFQAAERPRARNVSFEWATSLAAEELGNRLAAGMYSNQLGLDLVDLLAQQDQTQAIATCWRLLGDRSSPLRLRAASNLASLAPADMLVHLATGSWTNQELYAFVARFDVRELDTEELEFLARFLLDRFPIADDPPWEGGWTGDAHAQDTLRARTHCLEQLSNRGLADVLLRLNIDRDQVETNFLKLLIRRARVSNADLAVKPLRPSDLIRLLEQADARLIRDPVDLQSALLHQLDVIQHELRTTGLYRDIWNQTDHEASPKNEDSISDWLQRQLRLRFNRPIFIDREVQVKRPSEYGIGTRIDLTSSITSDTRLRSEVRVIVEAKLVNNDEVNSAMKDQLYQKYLDPLQLSHGLYLVFWIRPDQRPPKWSKTVHADAAALLQHLQMQAQSIPEASIIPFVLDISMPAKS